MPLAMDKRVDSSFDFWISFLAATSDATPSESARAMDILRCVQPESHRALISTMCRSMRVSATHGASWQRSDDRIITAAQFAASLAILRRECSSAAGGAAPSAMRASDAFDLASSIVELLVATPRRVHDDGDDDEAVLDKAWSGEALRSECCAFVAAIASAAAASDGFVVDARARCCAVLSSSSSAALVEPTALALSVALVDASRSEDGGADALRASLWTATLDVLVRSPDAARRRHAAQRIVKEVERPLATQRPPLAQRIEEAWAATCTLAATWPGDALLLTSALAVRCYFPDSDQLDGTSVGAGAGAGAEHSAGSAAAGSAVPKTPAFWDILARCVAEGRRGERKHAVYLIRSAARRDAAPWNPAQWETLCRCIESMDEHVYHLIEPSWSFAMESLARANTARSEQGVRWINALLRVALDHPTYRVRRLALHHIFRSESAPHVCNARIGFALCALNESRRLSVESVKMETALDTAEDVALEAAEGALLESLSAVTATTTEPLRLLLAPGDEARKQTSTHWYASLVAFATRSAVNFEALIRAARSELDAVPATILVTASLHVAANVAAQNGTPLFLTPSILATLTSMLAISRLNSVKGAPGAVGCACLGIAFALAPAAEPSDLGSLVTFVKAAVHSIGALAPLRRAELYASCGVWLLRCTANTSPPSLLRSISDVGADAELIALLFLSATSPDAAVDELRAILSAALPSDAPLDSEAGSHRALVALHNASRLGVLHGEAHTRVALAFLTELVSYIDRVTVEFVGQASGAEDPDDGSMKAVALLAACRVYVASVSSSRAADAALSHFGTTRWPMLESLIGALPTASWTAQCKYFIVVEMAARCSKQDDDAATSVAVSGELVDRIMRTVLTVPPPRQRRRLGGVDAATTAEQARWRAIAALLELLGDGTIGCSGGASAPAAVLERSTRCSIDVAAAVVLAFDAAAEGTSVVLVRCALAVLPLVDLTVRLELLEAATVAFANTKMTSGLLVSYLLDLATHECWRTVLCEEDVEQTGAVAAAVQHALCALCDVGGVLVTSDVVRRCCVTLWKWGGGCALQRHFLKEAVSMLIVGDLSASIQPTRLLGSSAVAARAIFLHFILDGAGGAPLRATLLSLLLAIASGDAEGAALKGASEFTGQESSVKSSLNAAKRNLWQSICCVLHATSTDAMDLNLRVARRIWTHLADRAPIWNIRHLQQIAMVIVLDRCGEALDEIVLPVLLDSNSGFNAANNAVIITGMVLAAMWARDDDDSGSEDVAASAAAGPARRRELLIALAPWMLTANHVPRTVAQVVFSNALQSLSPTQLARECECLGPMAAAMLRYIMENSLIKKAHRSASKSSVLSLVLPHASSSSSGGVDSASSDGGVAAAAAAAATVADWWSLSRCLRLDEAAPENGEAAGVNSAAEQRSVDLNEAVRFFFSAAAHSYYEIECLSYFLCFTLFIFAGTLLAQALAV